MNASERHFGQYESWKVVAILQHVIKPFERLINVTAVSIDQSQPIGECILNETSKSLVRLCCVTQGKVGYCTSVISVGLGWIFGRYMDFDTIQWHFYLGYATGILLLIRCLRGVVGPAPIRFSSLFGSISHGTQYLGGLLRRMPSGTPGHNPLGSLSVIAMILLLATQAISGMFIESDDFFESGPLAAYASEAFIRRMTWIHRTLADWILIIVVLHVSAILFYLLWKKENLIKPMITGWKWVKK